MTDAKDVRRDVEAVLVLYRFAEYFPVRCISTLSTIHESRLDIVDFWEPKNEEQASTPRAPRVVYGSAGTFLGKRLVNVIPRSAAAEIIRSNGGTRRAVIPTDRERPLWKASVAVVLAKVGRDRQSILLTGVDALIDLWASRNFVKVANQQLGSPVARRRMGREQRRRTETRRSVAAELEAESKRKRLEIRSRKYRDAIVRFDDAVQRLAPSDRAYIFREDR